MSAQDTLVIPADEVNHEIHEKRRNPAEPTRLEAAGSIRQRDR